jgi:membrane-bound ClpP family serine protease
MVFYPLGWLASLIKWLAIIGSLMLILGLSLLNSYDTNPFGWIIAGSILLVLAILGSFVHLAVSAISLAIIGEFKEYKEEK